MFDKAVRLCPYYNASRAIPEMAAAKWITVNTSLLRIAIARTDRENTRGLSLQLRHNGRDGASNHQPHGCLLNRLFRCGSKKTSKPRVTGLCARNSPVTDEFPAQKASNAENVSIWWRHHGTWLTLRGQMPLYTMLPVAATMLTLKSNMFSSNINWLAMILSVGPRDFTRYQGFLLLKWINLILGWICNNMSGNVWVEITYSFPNFTGCTVGIWEWICNSTHTL